MSEQEFRERMHLAGCLSMHLSQQMWEHYGPLHLGSEEFEVLGPEDAPGYDEEDFPVLIRRKSDGKVFEVEIEPEVRVARTAATTGSKR